MLPSPTMSKALTTDTPPASYSNSSSESGFCFAGATCAAVCLVDRNGANSREIEERNVLVQHYNKPLLCDFLADRSTMSSAVDFHKSIFGCLPVSSVGLISIAVPFSVDWEGVTLYPGIIMSSGAQRNQGLNTLFLEFPDVEGWLEDDFTQAMMAQIELAETVFNCDRLVVCVDSEANSVVRTLQYVGFSILKENIVLPHHGLTVPVSQNTEFFFLQYVTEHCRQ